MYAPPPTDERMPVSRLSSNQQSVTSASIAQIPPPIPPGSPQVSFPLMVDPEITKRP